MDLDLKTKESIQFAALSVFSENLVKARQRIETMHAQLRDPATDTITKALLHSNLRGSMQSYDSFRIKQAKKKQGVLETLYAKYPDLDQDSIQKCLDIAVNEHELEERNSNAQVYNSIAEMANITIPVYTTPLANKKDMAVLLVYFNACSYKKLAQNMCLIYHTLTRAGIPVFLVEHCFKDQTPLFPENGTTIFNTRSDSYMFYKENLLNWLMPKVPAQYTKFFMMDCDLLFDNDTWYDDVSMLLDTHDAVHPFENAVWLGSDLKTVDLKKISILAGRDNSDLGLKLMHPGFAWAFRRDFIEPRGVFDINIMGSGDTILASSVIQINKNHGPWQTNSLDWIIEEFNKYFMKFRDNRSTFYRQTVYHLWHGSQMLRRNNKRYTDFKTACSEHSINTKDDIFALNKYGLYEYTEPVREAINNIFLEFFETRDEDSV